ncbi:hypothetical protein LTR56_015909 [Elasticomyces elasticus]|nr:hypothetical protein LTR56_015909 [Elasticomyces elasticus]KAK3655334.1 hypothetical protein LTR22_010364 [Elasticomyces elasticus]KAK4918690.1 hypothetical protein LTR49_013615 [Elasticomyces elasticus]KAK5744065.1 hypothetical protein LTS12_023635 [Elasticomyces elasticus]
MSSNTAKTSLTDKHTTAMSTPTSPNLMSLPEELLSKIFAAAVPLDCPAASKANVYSVWELNTLVSRSYYRIAEEAFIENFVTHLKLRYPESWTLNINGISAVKNTWPKEIQYPIRKLQILVNAPDRQGIQTAITDIENGLDMYGDLREVTVMLETEEVAKRVSNLEDELWTNLFKRRKDMICRRGCTVRLTVASQTCVSVRSADKQGRTVQAWQATKRRTPFPDTPAARQARARARFQRRFGRPITAVLMVLFWDSELFLALMLASIFVGNAVCFAGQAVQHGILWQLVLFLSVLLYVVFEVYLASRALRQQVAHGVPQQPALHTGPVIRAISGFLVNASLNLSQFMNW